MSTPIVESLDDLEIPTTRANPISRLVMFAVLGLCMYIGWQYMGPKTAMAEHGWIDDWDSAIDRTRSSGKPALVLFTADWCPACKQLESEVLSRENVAIHLKENFTLVVVDLSDRAGPNNARAQEFGVRSIPTLIRYDKANQEIGRTNGMAADELMAWLK